MKKETIKIIKKKAREELGSVPAQRVEKTGKEYKRREKHKKETTEKDED